MFNFNSVLLSSEKPEGLVAFYQKVFGKDPDMEMDEYTGWLVGKCFLTIGPHTELSGPAKEPQRFIINFETEEVESEFERLVELGAKSVKEPYQMEDAWIATLEDPDGNYFQLMSPWKEK